MPPTIRTQIHSPSDYVSSPVKVTLPTLWTGREVEAKVFLTRQHEVYMWVQDALNAKLSSPDLGAVLRDGRTLIALASAIAPKLVREAEVHRSPASAAERKANVRAFLRWCRRLAIPKRRCFAVADLYRKADMHKVVNTLHVVAALAARRGFTPRLAKIHPEDILFPPEDLAEAVAYLDTRPVVTQAEAEARPADHLLAAAVPEPSLAHVRSGLPDRLLTTYDLAEGKYGEGAAPMALVHMFDLAVEYAAESGDDDPAPDDLYMPDPEKRYEPVHPLEIAHVTVPPTPARHPLPVTDHARINRELNDPLLKDLHLSEIDSTGGDDIDLQDLHLESVDALPVMEEEDEGEGEDEDDEDDGLLDLEGSDTDGLLEIEDGEEGEEVVLDDEDLDDLLALDEDEDEDEDNDDELDGGVLSGELAGEGEEDDGHGGAMFELSESEPGGEDAFILSSDAGLAATVGDAESVGGAKDTFVLSSDDDNDNDNEKDDHVVTSPVRDVEKRRSAEVGTFVLSSSPNEDAFVLDDDGDGDAGGVGTGGVGTRRAVALYDFEAGDDRQLSFAKGSRLYVYTEEKDGWVVGQDSDDGYGFVPVNRIRFLGLDEETDDDGEDGGGGVGKVQVATAPKTSRIAQLQEMLAAQGGGLFGKPSASGGGGGGAADGKSRLESVTADRPKAPGKRAPSRKKRKRKKRAKSKS